MKKEEGLFLFLAHPENSLGANNEYRVEQDAHRRRHDDREATEKAGWWDLSVSDRHYGDEYGP